MDREQLVAAWGVFCEKGRGVAMDECAWEGSEGVILVFTLLVEKLSVTYDLGVSGVFITGIRLISMATLAPEYGSRQVLTRVCARMCPRLPCVTSCYGCHAGN